MVFYFLQCSERALCRTDFCRQYKNGHLCDTFLLQGHQRIKTFTILQFTAEILAAFSHGNWNGAISRLLRDIQRRKIYKSAVNRGKKASCAHHPQREEASAAVGILLMVRWVYNSYFLCGVVSKCCSHRHHFSTREQWNNKTKSEPPFMWQNPRKNISSYGTDVKETKYFISPHSCVSMKENQRNFSNVTLMFCICSSLVWLFYLFYISVGIIFCFSHKTNCTCRSFSLSSLQS